MPHSLVTKMLSYEHSFMLDNIEYVGNFAQCRINQKSGNSDMSKEISAIFDQFRDAAIQRRLDERAAEKDGKVVLQDDICSICCSEEPDTEFVPCGHTSCRRCISRHLMNNTNCFFCNAVVEETKALVKEHQIAETVKQIDE